MSNQIEPPFDSTSLEDVAYGIKMVNWLLFDLVSGEGNEESLTWSAWQLSKKLGDDAYSLVNKLIEFEHRIRQKAEQ